MSKLDGRAYPFGPLRPLCHIVLDRPRIFGNIAACVRLCANIGATLHICGPFPEQWRGPLPASFKRAGLDYWAHASMLTHQSLERCLEWLDRKPVVIEVDGGAPHSSFEFNEGEVIVFGPEDGSVSAQLDARARVFLPSRAETRSLNLSQCVAVIGFEVQRTVGI